ncbi:30S ribosomal protein S6 [Acidithrix ferrooxidans]|uniref:Small ribosomal subunit protein bS6 n=1 Tax=Acidithrix ferrooxidans TaxID=1280514 RepID=A0A0D8HFJ4_9ACTN|nr:30S ribosomal protein S6 [Acidithrix ferrooxidans]KJF16735.1 30S ribosomal protein S6 [Acidithrix ferrooxidans]
MEPLGNQGPEEEYILLRPYELMVILDSRLNDSDSDGIITRVLDLLRKDGNVGRIDRWGRRKLAYEINKVSEGNYSIIEFASTPATVTEISRILSISDGVLRHKIIRLPERIAGRVLAKEALAQE